MAARPPVVLVLDDLHWADAATCHAPPARGALRARHRWLLLGAYRDVEVTPEQPLADALGALPRETAYEHSRSAGLGGAEVEELLEAVADQAVPAALVTAITTETSGNPFFIREVLLHLVEEGKLVRRDGQWTADVPIAELGIPESVRQVIQRRLARLSASANRLLRAAAGFTAVSATTSRRAWRVLTRPTRSMPSTKCLPAQLVQPAGDAETFDFIHALVRHTLYAELSPPRQARLHRQIAETMEHAYGVHARRLRGRDRAALPPECLVAGRRARGCLLPGRRRARRGRAQRSRRRRIPADGIGAEPDGRCRGAHVCSRVWRWRTRGVSHSNRRSRPRCEAARRSRRSREMTPPPSSSPTRATRCGSRHRPVARGRSPPKGCATWASRRDTTWARLMVYDIERREATDPEFPGIPVDSPERREVTARLWELPAFRHPTQQMFAYVGFRSREDVLARAGTDPTALIFWAADYRKALPLCDRAAATALDQGRIALAIYYLTIMARAQTALGDLASSMATYSRALTLYERIDVQPWLHPFIQTVFFSQTVVTGVGFELALAVAESRLDEDAEENRWTMAGIRAVAAWCAAHLGRADDALHWLRSILPWIERAPGSTMNYVGILAMATHTLDELDRTDHLEVLERNIREKWLRPDFRYVLTDSRFALALLSGLRGRYDEAVELFAQARAIFDEQGSAPMRARSDLL